MIWSSQNSAVSDKLWLAAIVCDGCYCGGDMFVDGGRVRWQIGDFLGCCSGGGIRGDGAVVVVVLVVLVVVLCSTVVVAVDDSDRGSGCGSDGEMLVVVVSNV
ncbi:Hypothetical predicted protein [Olea europaea subsp. europaea]|uniref:Transmembrane protein n=1 Tax=Olea europaea subsp. europaea TaxID=158383 RepID=A0A8S0UMR5_OLEEU|nr:Hypothetical predicted protein [Olea europaea subsp. europaea]